MTPSDPAAVLILVLDYINELTIHSFYVNPFCVKKMYNTSFIGNLMKEIVQRLYTVCIEGFRNCTIII